MKILVTGSSGYLGSKLCQFLSNNNEVTGILRSTSDKRRVLDAKYDVAICDTFEQIDTLFDVVKPDVVINTVTVYGRQGENYSDLIYTNIEYPTKLLELADKHSTKAFINTGTSLPSNVSAYALTKNTFSELAKFKILDHVKFIDIILEHFYGPDDDRSKFITYVVKQCLDNKDLNLTEGTQKRDFIYITDVVSAYQTVIKNLDSFDSHDQISLGSGSAITIREVVENIHLISHSSSKLNFGAIKMRACEVHYSCANIQKLKSLGWSPFVSLSSGILNTIEQFQ